MIEGYPRRVVVIGMYVAVGGGYRMLLKRGTFNIVRYTCWFYGCMVPFDKLQSVGTDADGLIDARCRFFNASNFA